VCIYVYPEAQNMIRSFGIIDRLVEIICWPLARTLADSFWCKHWGLIQKYGSSNMVDKVSIWPVLKSNSFSLFILWGTDYAYNTLNQSFLSSRFLSCAGFLTTSGISEGNWASCHGAGNINPCRFLWMYTLMILVFWTSCGASFVTN